ncbi:MAG: hypothetical protein AAGC55_03985, partial [Myxococcota bacterium]
MMPCAILLLAALALPGCQFILGIEDVQSEAGTPITDGGTGSDGGDDATASSDAMLPFTCPMGEPQRLTSTPALHSEEPQLAHNNDETVVLWSDDDAIRLNRLQTPARPSSTSILVNANGTEWDPNLTAGHDGFLVSTVTRAGPDRDEMQVYLWPDGSEVLGSPEPVLSQNDIASQPRLIWNGTEYAAAVPRDDLIHTVVFDPPIDAVSRQFTAMWGTGDGFITRVVWNPDREQFAIAYEQNGNTYLLRTNRDGVGVNQGTTELISETGFVEADIVWDGEEYVVARIIGTQLDLILRNAEGEPSRELNTSWSTGPNPNDIRLMAIDTGYAVMWTAEDPDGGDAANSWLYFMTLDSEFNQVAEPAVISDPTRDVRRGPDLVWTGEYFI